MFLEQVTIIVVLKVSFDCQIWKPDRSNRWNAAYLGFFLLKVGFLFRINFWYYCIYALSFCSHHTLSLRFILIQEFSFYLVFSIRAGENILHFWVSWSGGIRWREEVLTGRTVEYRVWSIFDVRSLNVCTLECSITV